MHTPRGLKSSAVGLLIILCGILAGYVYQIFVPSELGAPFTSPPPLKDETFLKFKDITFNLSFLNQPPFTVLKPYNTSAIQPVSGVREDIFNQ